MKKCAWKTIAVWVLGVEAVGALAGFLTRDGVKLYQATVTKPPLTPPGIVFPIVWGILFLLLGIGGGRIAQKPASQARLEGLWVFFLQLAFNFFWSILFFSFQWFGLAFLWLLILWGLIAWMIYAFHRLDPLAAWLQVPYLLWVTFAAYLNAGVWLLQR